MSEYRLVPPPDMQAMIDHYNGWHLVPDKAWAEYRAAMKVWRALYQRLQGATLDDDPACQEYALQAHARIADFGLSKSFGFGEFALATMPKQEPVENMDLKDIQAELRSVSSTPVRGKDDRCRRAALWRRLDKLIADERRHALAA